MEQATMKTLAANFARIDSDRDATLRAICTVLGEEPTFDQWEAARLEAVAGYRTVKPNATDDAAGKFWARLVQAASKYASEEGFDFAIPSKPKAETPEAARKRESRANPFEGKKAADIRADMETIGTNIKAADPAAIPPELVINYNKAAKALLKAEKAEAREAGKAAADALKPRREAISKTLKDADATTLALIESALATRDPARSRSAWALILAACPQEIRLAELSVAMRGSEPQKPKRGRKDSVTA